MSTAPTPTTSAPSSAPAAGRRPSARVALRRFARVAPASVALAAIVSAMSIATGTLWQPTTAGGGAPFLAAGVSTTVQSGLWWTPLTALLVPENAVQTAVCLVLALTLLAGAERLLGTARAVVAFLMTGVLGIALGVLGQWGAAGALNPHAALSDVTLDPTIGIVGALIAGSAFASALWRRRIRALTFATVLMLVLYNGDQNNVYRLLAALLGLALGVVLRRERLRRIRRSSHGETRTLVAAVVGVTALGPLAALLPPGGYGPFSFVSSLFQDEQMDAASMLAQCAAANTSACRSELALLSGQGFGPLLLSMLPLVLLLVTAVGLRRARHFALVLGIVVNTAMIALPLIALSGGSIAFDVHGFAPLGPALSVLTWLLAVVLVPAASIALLVTTRRHFQIRAPREAVMRFALLTVITFALLAVAYLVAGLGTLSGYVPESTIGDVFASTLHRFVPAGFASAIGPVIVPTTPVVLVLYQWVGPMFWLIFVLGVLRLYRATSTGRTPGDELRFRELLRTAGGGTLGFMGTWPGNVYWFTEEGDGAVAYRVVGDAAIALSDPVCRPEDAERTIIDFVAFCEANGWTPAFHTIHSKHLRVFESLGWQAAPVGDETLVRPQAFERHDTTRSQTLSGDAAERTMTTWTTWSELAPVQQSRIAALSEQWISEKELPEMGFTLGGMAELRDPDVRLCLAYDQAGELQAVTSWLPSWRNERVVGYTSDFMRRSDHSLPGIMELVIASAAQRMQADGVESLSLSRVPLAGGPDAAGDAGEPDPVARVLAFLTETLEPAYGFVSLHAFTSAFDPSRETLWLTYPDPAALPAIGNALGKAYLPDTSVRTLAAVG